MAESSKLKKITAILQELLEQKGIPVEKIIVFGSRSKRTFREDSDLDLIVVARTFEKKGIFEKVEMTAGIHRQLVKKIKMPVDIIYLSPTEWQNQDSLLASYARQNLAA